MSAENAPLLQFITKYAGVIAGIVLALLLILGGMAIWNWHKSGKEDEARAELARINMQLKGEAKDQALLNLAQKAPDSTKLFIYLSLGQSAQENGNPVLAADAYARAAKLDNDGPLGLTAALGSVGSLMMQAEYQQALACSRNSTSVCRPRTIPNTCSKCWRKRPIGQATSSWPLKLIASLARKQARPSARTSKKWLMR